MFSYVDTTYKIISLWHWINIGEFRYFEAKHTCQFQVFISYFTHVLWPGQEWFTFIVSYFLTWHLIILCSKKSPSKIKHWICIRKEIFVFVFSVRWTGWRNKRRMDMVIFQVLFHVYRTWVSPSFVFSWGKGRDKAQKSPLSSEISHFIEN